jgi:putative aldouronate transport system substrate-binding protein
MKKLVMFLLIVSVLFSVTLAANGKSDASAGELKPLIWYVPGGAGFPYNETEEAAVYTAFNEMAKEAIGTSVEIRAQGKFGEYNETMPLILASGEYLDLIWTAPWSNDFLKNANDGFYAGLDELLETYGKDILADTREQLEATRINGEIRGVWSQQIAAYNSNIQVQTPMAEKYGWDMDSVKSMRDIEPFLKDIAENEPDLLPFGVSGEPWKLAQNYYGIVNFSVLPNVVGTYVADEDITVINLIESPEYRDWCSLMNDWYKKGYIPKDGLTYSFDQWNQLKNQSRTVFNHHNTYNPQNKAGLRAGVPFDSFRIGKPATITTNIINTINSVSAGSNQKEKAVELLNFLWTDKDAYNTLVWGLEGRHYQWTDATHIKPIEDSGYYTNIPWMWGNTFNSFLTGNQPETLFDEVRELNRTSIKAPSLGFNPNVEEVKTLIASVSAVVDQYNVPVSGGYIDPAKGISEYLDALKKAGVDELIEKLQMQVDAWKKVNK